MIEKSRHIDDGLAIARTVFEENLPQLRQETAHLMIARADELSRALITRIQREKPGLISAMSDPGFLLCLRDAQLAAASSGEKELARLLLELLFARAQELKRSLRSIVFERAVSAASILTSHDLDMALLILLTREIVPPNSGSLGLFTRWFQPALNSWLATQADLAALDASTSNLIAAGAAYSDTRRSIFESMTMRRYPQLFGMPPTTWSEAAAEDMQKQLSLCDPAFLLIARNWNRSDLARMNLSTVGMALAQAHRAQRSTTETAE